MDNNEIVEPVLFFSCVSFEERYIGSLNITLKSKISDIYWFLFQIIDSESTYRSECYEIQKNNCEILQKRLKLRNSIPEYDLMEPNLVEEIIEKFKTEIESKEYKTIILDISTMPKTVYIPFLKWFLSYFKKKANSLDFIICYTKPHKYGPFEIESEPSSPINLINYIEDEKPVLWLPCLGFKSEFTKKIWEMIQILEVEKDIIPIMCFPTFRPDYFDRSLVLHDISLKSDTLFIEKLKENVIFCAANDPFDIYYRIKEISRNHQDEQLILSPVGSKPTTLGIALAAIKCDIPILSIQAKTYHPEYSQGYTETVAFWIIREGVLFD